MKRVRYSPFVFWGVLLLCSGLSAQQAAVSSSTSAAAVVPRLVNFSGKAIDQGKTVTGIAGITFAIYREEAGGSPLWLETQNVQADVKGNYTAQLGATTGEGLPQELFTSGEARWLGVRINGGEEQPRVLLMSVPYALKAADAQTLGGLPASAFMPAVPVAAGSSSSSAASAPADISTAAVSGTGTTDFLPLWTNSSGALGNSVLFQSGTGATAKTGVNTTTPTSTLDVNGATTVLGTLSLPATGAATASAGKNSAPQAFTASVFNSSTATAVGQKFSMASRADQQQHGERIGRFEFTPSHGHGGTFRDRPENQQQRSAYVRRRSDLPRYRQRIGDQCWVERTEFGLHGGRDAGDDRGHTGTELDHSSDQRRQGQRHREAGRRG